jgi:peroxisomal 2,4-dienoyl-CoA reductase
MSSSPPPPIPSSPFQPNLFQGKVVLCSGGGTGIGLGICKEFVNHGAKVFITSRREQILQQAVEEHLGGNNSAGFLKGDVRDPESCKQVVAACMKKFGRIDVLVNNAAGNFSTAAEDLSPNALKTVLEIDFHGSFNMSKAALESLKATKGVIINISATLYYKAFPFQMHAAAAKAAIDVMTQSLGVEWAVDHGIRVVSIAPGPIEGTVGGPPAASTTSSNNNKTTSAGKEGRVFGGFRATPEHIKQVVPIGRYGTVNDISYCALFVASDAGSFINATRIVVDGGHWHETSGMFMKGRKAIKEYSESEKKTTKGGVSKL